MMRFCSLLTLLALTVALSACGSKALLGQKAAPDETHVVDGPSLTLPPEFTLRPPADGRMVEESLKRQEAANPDDAWLLEQAGPANPKIREELSTEEKAEEEKAEKEKAGSWWPF